MNSRKGTIQVYTGNGKGKTTASLGQAIRAAGHGWKVVMIQFMKGRLYGELASCRNMEGVSIEQHGRDEFVDPKNPEPVDLELAGKGWARALELAADRGVDMLILDEVNVAVSFGLIPLEDLVRLVKGKREDLELILTGRYADRKIIDLADTVTEMREIKHHYRQGIESRKGIEF